MLIEMLLTGFLHLIFRLFGGQGPLLNAWKATCYGAGPCVLLGWAVVYPSLRKFSAWQNRRLSAGLNPGKNPADCRIDAWFSALGAGFGCRRPHHHSYLEFPERKIQYPYWTLLVGAWSLVLQLYYGPKVLYRMREGRALLILALFIGATLWEFATQGTTVGF